MTLTPEKINDLLSGATPMTHEQIDEAVKVWVKTKIYGDYVGLAMLSILMGDLNGVAASVGAALQRGFDIGQASAQAETLEHMMEDSQ